jgi:hypothetical protein
MDSSSTIPLEAESLREMNEEVQGEHHKIAAAVPSIVVTDTNAKEAGQNKNTEEDKEASASTSEDDEDIEEEEGTDREYEIGWRTMENIDPKVKKLIPMPSGRKEKKKNALVSVFLWFSKWALVRRDNHQYQHDIQQDPQGPLDGPFHLTGDGAASSGT